MASEYWELLPGLLIVTIIILWVSHNYAPYHVTSLKELYVS